MNALEKLSNATRMLAEVRSAQDAMKLMDLAAAAEYYARKMKLGAEAVTYAHTIKIDSMELLGGYLEKEIEHRGASAKRVPDGNSFLPEGISRKESMNAQFLHLLATDDPELFKKVRNGATSLTAARRIVQRAAVAKVAQLPSEKYRVLYADPPWKYGDQLTEDYGPAEYHYPSMSISELCALPIGERAEENAVLFLWVTSPLLEDAFPVINAWDFTYKTSFVWDKVKHNMGHYNSVRHEFLLVATRGSCTPDVPKLYDSVVSIERTTHSSKPEEFRQMIDTLYPYGKRLELFARTQAEGWDVWGNQSGAAAEAV